MIYTIFPIDGLLRYAKGVACSSWATSRSPPTLAHWHLLPYSPLFHERALLLPSTMDQMSGELLTSELVVNKPVPHRMGSVLLKLVLLISNMLLDDRDVHRHRLAVGPVREVVETDSETKCSEGGLRKPTSFSETLSINST